MYLLNTKFLINHTNLNIATVKFIFTYNTCLSHFFISNHITNIHNECIILIIFSELFIYSFNFNLIY